LRRGLEWMLKVRISREMVVVFEKAEGDFEKAQG
jgi:hypothetical protein